MRMYRSAARALGVLLAATPLALAVPSAAAPADDERRTTPRVAMVGDPPPATLTAFQVRTIHSKVVSRDDRLILRGDVEDYSRGWVIVQRKKCYDCSWERHEVVRSGVRGRFHSQIGARKRGSTYWRAKVPASDGYARSYSATWETYY